MLVFQIEIEYIIYIVGLFMSLQSCYFGIIIIDILIMIYKN
jgi:hypothetical protein